LGEMPRDLERWASRLADNVRERRDELARVMPWLRSLRDRRGSISAGPQTNAELLKRWQSIEKALISPSSVADLVVQSESLVAGLTELEQLWPVAEGRAF